LPLKAQANVNESLLDKVLLILEILPIFLPISSVSNVVREITFSTNQSMRIQESNFRIFESLCWIATSKKL
jgi:hypothetical protein